MSPLAASVQNVKAESRTAPVFAICSTGRSIISLAGDQMIRLKSQLIERSITDYFDHKHFFLKIIIHLKLVLD